MSERVKAVPIPTPPVPLAGGPGEDDPLLGRVIDGRFHIRSLIARGGMGRVYRAEQSPLGRVCALKVVNGTLAGADPEYERRFKLEASTAAKLTHPNTVTVFDYGKTGDGIFFMAMELLEGRTLHKVLRDEGSLSPERASRVAAQICRSLREAHHHGVVHRDLKPANVFLVAHGDEPDFVKVLDFGLVKSLDERPEEQLTQTGIFMGSPKYMAPEQIEGHKVDARTDIYSLGIMMYEMLTGRPPFDKATSVKTLMAHVHEAPAALTIGAPGVSPALEDLVLRCLSKQPTDRPSSMEEVLSALRAGSPHTVSENRQASSSRVPTIPPARPNLPKPSLPPPSSSRVQSKPASSGPGAPLSSGQPVSSAQITKLLHGAGEALQVTEPIQRPASVRPPAFVPGSVSAAGNSSGELSPVARSHAGGASSTSLQPLGRSGRSRHRASAVVALLGAFAVTLGGGLGVLAVRMRPATRMLPSSGAATLRTDLVDSVHAAPSAASPAEAAAPAASVSTPPTIASAPAAPAPSASAAAPKSAPAVPPRPGRGRRLPALPRDKSETEAPEGAKAPSL